VLAVGVGLNQFTTAFGTQFSPEATLIQIDVLSEKTNPRVDLYIRGDAEDATTRLSKELTGHMPPASPWGGTVEEARSSRLNFSRDTGTGQATDGLLDPRTAMVRLNDILPSNRQVVSDGGHFIGWSSYYFDLPAPDSLTMVGTQYQSIGLGLPSAPGAALARPDATTIVATGDGGGLMGLPDLDSLVRTAKSAVVLVFNDACYSAEIHQYGSQGLDQKIMEIKQVDFSKLAEGLGATGLAVHTMGDLGAVQQWVDEGARGTLVVDLRISRNVIAPYITEIIELTLKKK
jgi:thiamine pyrophosphate-dependent acetolactate synthase large subunit-like protein